MVLKNISRILLCAILVCAGCKKSETPPPPAAPAPVTNSVAANAIATNASPIAPTTLVSRIHWLGKKKIAADTNAASLMAIWNLPESTRLEEQTLDKLSRNLLAGTAAPRGDNPQSTNSQIVADATNPPSAQVTNQLSVSNQISALSASSNHLSASNDISAFRVPSSAFLRPLLDDVLNEESYFEIRGKTNGPQEWIFAIRLDPARAALWETNLNQLSAINLPLSAIRHLLSAKLSRTGDWTILASGRADLPVGRGSLFDDVLARMEKTHSPFAPGATNWLDSDLDLDQIVSGTNSLTSILRPPFSPRIFLAIDGDGKNVFTRGQLAFVTPPPLKPEPWSIPTNLISPIFSSFSAMRGFKPLMESVNAWTNLNLGATPNQLFLWSVPGAEAASYFVTPSKEADSQVAHISNLAIEKVNPWLTTNGSPLARTSRFEKSVGFNGIEWKGAPFMSPFLKTMSLTNGDFIMGGFFPLSGNKRPLPAPLITELTRTNVIYYSIENTGPRIEPLLHIMQFLRMLGNYSQLPPDSQGLQWLGVLEPKLGESVTELIAITPDRFSFTRRSSIGATAMELHLLVDWLESPSFPRGLYTTLTPMPVRRPLPHKTPTAVTAPPGM